jgi:hypothetical protein
MEALLHPVAVIETSQRSIACIITEGQTDRQTDRQTVLESQFFPICLYSLFHISCPLLVRPSKYSESFKPITNYYILSHLMHRDRYRVSDYIRVSALLHNSHQHRPFTPIPMK